MVYTELGLDYFSMSVYQNYSFFAKNQNYAHLRECIRHAGARVNANKLVGWNRRMFVVEL